MKCEYYDNGEAKEDAFLGMRVIICPKELCPYGYPQEKLQWEGDEFIICNNHNLISRLGVKNSFEERLGIVRNVFMR